MQDAIIGIPEHYKYQYCGWWEEIKGGNVCKECDLSITDYILECRQCLLRACLTVCALQTLTLF